MIDQQLFEQFQYIGRDIFDAGLTSSHGGNLSMRVGDRIIIKRRGAQFRRLKPEDFVETQLYKKDSGLTRAQHRTDRASRDLLTDLGPGGRSLPSADCSGAELVPG